MSIYLSISMVLYTKWNRVGSYLHKIHRRRTQGVAHDNYDRLLTTWCFHVHLASHVNCGRLQKNVLILIYQGHMVSLVVIYYQENKYNRKYRHYADHNNFRLESLELFRIFTYITFLAQNAQNTILASSSKYRNLLKDIFETFL